MSPPPTTNEPAPAVDQLRWFTEQVHSHDGQLKSYIRGSFPSVRDVDDVVQESYLRIWKARATREIQSAKAFLFSVARHIAIDVLRRDRRNPADRLGDFSVDSVLDDKPNAAEAAREREKMVLLADAVLTLPARCREIVILRKIHGFSQKEVAARLDLSERTIENQCRIGIQRCERYLRRAGMNTLWGE